MAGMRQFGLGESPLCKPWNVITIFRGSLSIIIHVVLTLSFRPSLSEKRGCFTSSPSKFSVEISTTFLCPSSALTPRTACGQVIHNITQNDNPLDMLAKNHGKTCGLQFVYHALLHTKVNYTCIIQLIIHVLGKDSFWIKEICTLPYNKQTII